MPRLNLDIMAQNRLDMFLLFKRKLTNYNNSQLDIARFGYS